MRLKEPRNPRGQAKQYYVQYANARRCAKERNIEWQFTYDTWIEWWGTDIANRGCRKGQLVMARNGDIGPYHPDNVRKTTCNDNYKEMLSHRVTTEATREKFRQRMMGNTLRHDVTMQRRLETV
jgi:hypothetical protein